jgi:hypothetical protein
VGRFGVALVRRTTKVLLWIVALLLAVASAAIAATFLILEWPRAASARVNMAKRTSERRTGWRLHQELRQAARGWRESLIMIEGVTAYAYHIGEAVAPYILDPALMRVAGIALVIAPSGC